MLPTPSDAPQEYRMSCCLNEEHAVNFSMSYERTEIKVSRFDLIIIRAMQLAHCSTHSCT